MIQEWLRPLADRQSALEREHRLLDTQVTFRGRVDGEKDLPGWGAYRTVGDLYLDKDMSLGWLWLGNEYASFRWARPRLAWSSGAPSPTAADLATLTDPQDGHLAITEDDLHLHSYFAGSWRDNGPLVPLAPVITISPDEPTTHAFPVAPKDGDWFFSQTSSILYVHSGGWVSVSASGDLDPLFSAGVVPPVWDAATAYDTGTWSSTRTASGSPQRPPQPVRHPASATRGTAWPGPPVPAHAAAAGPPEVTTVGVGPPTGHTFTAPPHVNDLYVDSTDGNALYVYAQVGGTDQWVQVSAAGADFDRPLRRPEPAAWVAQAYVADSVVEHNGQFWLARNDTVAGEEPGVDPKWRSLTLPDIWRHGNQKELPDYTATDAGKAILINPQGHTSVGRAPARVAARQRQGRRRRADGDRPDDGSGGLGDRQWAAAVHSR